VWWWSVVLGCSEAAPPDLDVVRYAHGVAVPVGEPLPVGAAIRLEVEGPPAPLLGCTPMAMSAPSSVRVAVEEVRVTRGQEHIRAPTLDVGGIAVDFTTLSAGDVELWLQTDRGGHAMRLVVQ